MTFMSLSKKAESNLELGEWPADGLESVKSCPACSDTERELLHGDLFDNTFRTAPGKWSLWKCGKCSSAYLDPRPSQTTIHRAYANYYTHEEPGSKSDYSSLTPGRRLRRRLVNGYTNWRYGTVARPASTWGLLAALALPRLRRILASEYRHLPKPPVAGTLLDVGCGGGSFLSRARTCGWNVVGLDPDANAAFNAKKRGLTVYHGGIDYFAGKKELFDVITLSHVIEHVHDPIKVLKTCHALLKPGGQLWLETPNIAGFGHAKFGQNWRGLEAPRHLVLYNRSSLKQILVDVGFEVPRDRARPSASIGMARASLAITHGRRPDESIPMPVKLRIWATIAALSEKFLPARREFLTLTAHKGRR